MQMPGLEFERGTVAAGGYQLEYAAAGPVGATTIVSLPGSAGIEMSIGKDLLARRYRVIEINPPGWGGRTDLNREITQRELASILAIAADQLAGARYHLLGTSMGGSNALWIAEQRPEAVQSVVLEGSMAPSKLDDLVMPPMTLEIARALVAATAAGSPPQYPLAPPHPRMPWADEAYQQAQMAKRMSMMAWVHVDFAAEEAIAALRARHTPILALLGSEDFILKPSQQQTLREVLPEARFEIVPRAVHDIQGSEPEAFERLLVSFIGG